MAKFQHKLDGIMTAHAADNRLLVCWPAQADAGGLPPRPIAGLAQEDQEEDRQEHMMNHYRDQPIIRNVTKQVLPVWFPSISHTLIKFSVSRAEHLEFPLFTFQLSACWLTWLSVVRGSADRQTAAG